MNYPTTEEIQKAFDGITADGEKAPVTADICSLIMTDPNLRETLFLTTEAGELVLLGDSGRMAFILSCLAKGLNIGLRISEARSAGMKSRQLVENLLGHYERHECEGNSECDEACVKILRWVLGMPKE
jgi:hypothetical protein